MTVSTAKCRRVYDTLPVYPRTAKPTVVARRMGMGISAFRSVLVQATFMFPICRTRRGCCPESLRGKGSRNGRSHQGAFAFQRHRGPSRRLWRGWAWSMRL